MTSLLAIAIKTKIGCGMFFCLLSKNRGWKSVLIIAILLRETSDHQHGGRFWNKPSHITRVDSKMGGKRMDLYEGILSRTEDPAGLKRRTIPLLFEKCEPSKFISMLTWVDLRISNVKLKHGKICLSRWNKENNPWTAHWNDFQFAHGGFCAKVGTSHQ